MAAFTTAAVLGGAALAGSAYQSHQAGKAAKAGSKAAGKASDLQYQASQDALAEQQRQFNTARADAKPWRTAGEMGLYDLQGLYGLGPKWMNDAAQSRYRADPMYAGELNNFQASPGYQFRMEEGLKALDRSAASRGMLRSGAQMKATQRYGEGLAADEYDRHYNRVTSSFNNYANRLSALAGVGQTTNQNLAALGANYANSAGNIMTSTANNMGNAAIAGAQARASGYQARGNIAGNLLNQGVGLGALYMGGGFGGNQGASVGLNNLMNTSGLY